MRSTFARAGAAALGLAVVLSAMPQPRAASAAGEPYQIGAIVSESGPGSSLGRPEADSIELAVDEINKAGGIAGRPLKVTILDDESNATTAVSDMRRLLEQRVIAILGPSLTQTSLAVIPLATQAQIPLISLASSAQIIEPVAERKWVFKMPVTDIHTAEVMQTYLKRRKQTKIGFVYRNDDYGKTGLQHFEDAGKAAGFTVAAAEAIAATASDATTQLTHIKAASPDAVVAWTTLPSAEVLIKNYRELSVPYPIYYSDGSATGLFVKQAGDTLNGAFIVTSKINVVDQLPANDPQKAVLRRYVESFDRLYPKDAPVGIFGGFGYDAANVLKAALAKAPGAESGRLRDALEHVTYTGVSGTFHLSAADHNGLSGDSQVLTRIDNQKFVIVR